MDEVLQGIPGVQCILDDMIITGKTDTEHLEHLEAVLQRLDQYGLRVNSEKCEFFKDQINFCGHIIDRDGVHKTPEKVNAILNAPHPENVSHLRAFLGLVNYYGRFIKNLASKLQPLYRLLEANSIWKWSSECDAALQGIKESITSEQVLTHYDPEKPVKLATDASPYGLGAVLSHVFEDDSERPIAFASGSLNHAEKKLFPDRYRSIRIGVGCEEILSIPIWKTFHFGDRSPTIGIHFSSRKRNFCNNSSSTAALCAVLSWFSIWHWIQKYEKAWKCRWIIASSHQIGWRGRRYARYNPCIHDVSVWMHSGIEQGCQECNCQRYSVIKSVWCCNERLDKCPG